MHAQTASEVTIYIHSVNVHIIIFIIIEIITNYAEFHLHITMHICK